LATTKQKILARRSSISIATWIPAKIEFGPFLQDLFFRDDPRHFTLLDSSQATMECPDITQ
jgi:hypothetical protein